MSTKNTGKFALAYRVLDESGNSLGVRAKITDDIILKRGQTVFFNEFTQEVQALAKNKIISQEEAEEKILQRQRLDREYNQETLYSVRAGKVPENNGMVGKIGASKL
jgi:hypothetical protein